MEKKVFLALALAGMFCGGLFYILTRPGAPSVSEFGGPSFKLDSANARAPASDPRDCPVNKFDYEQIPGFDPKNKSTFSKDQGHTNWCELYATTDLVCLTMNQHDQWPKGKDYTAGCSTLELAIQTAVRTGFHGSISDFGQMAFGYEDVINSARTVGICPESVFPSKYISDWRTSSLQKIKDSLAARVVSKASTEAGVPETGYCAECGFAPINKDQFEKIKYILDSGASDDVSSLKQVADILCEGKRIKLPPEIKFRHEDGGAAGYELFQRKLRAGQAVFFSIKTNSLDATQRPGDHAVLALGALERVGTDPPFHPPFGETCFIGVKNSWGMVCSQQNEIDRPPHVVCGATTGTYFVDMDRVMRDSTIFVAEGTSKVDCPKSWSCF